jgi:hypothetical protein
MAARYHSLVIKEETIPDCLEITAWTEDGNIMGVRHKEFPHIQVRVGSCSSSGWSHLSCIHVRAFMRVELEVHEVRFYGIGQD